MLHHLSPGRPGRGVGWCRDTAARVVRGLPAAARFVAAIVPLTLVRFKLAPVLGQIRRPNIVESAERVP